ncbi:MAG TPA: hypothetical protein VF796_30440 [Humisphaera sp.]
MRAQPFVVLAVGAITGLGFVAGCADHDHDDHDRRDRRVGRIENGVVVPARGDRWDRDRDRDRLDRDRYDRDRYDGDRYDRYDRDRF